MDQFGSFVQWFAGGSHPYMRLSECMNGDYFWIALTVMLDLGVAAGYTLIALHWYRNGRNMPKTPTRDALNSMRNIFAFCGICGYLFIPIKMFWPAWRLYDFFMLALVYSTWRYAWNARDLKVLYAELGRSSRLAEDLDRSREESRQKSIFLNSISHDLRTPLNGLVLQTNLARLAVQANDPDMAQSALTEIEAGARATSDMLDRLLEYARLNASEERNAMADLSLHSFVQQVAHALTPAAAAKGLTLTVSIPDQITIRSDSVKLERILNNLITNAIKFTEVGGITIQAVFAGAALELHVIDTGIGIAPEHQANLFREFFQVNNPARDRARGFGLGLATARRLALQLGGDLVVESAPWQGSRFTILLPNAIVSAPTPADALPSAQLIPS